MRFTIPALSSERSNSLGYATLAISPDGRALVYVGLGDDKRQQLMLRTLDDITARPLPETADANNPIFSPDGKWVAFVRSNQIFKVGIDGSRPQLLAAAPGIFGGMSWSSTGVIVVSGNVALYTIPETGGQPRELVKPNRSVGELYFITPLVVDDQGVVLYASSPSSAVAGSKIAMASLKTGEHVRLDIAGAQPLGMTGGVLTYVTSAGVIMGVPFDARKKKLTGAPAQLVSDVAINNTSGLARASLAANGTLFYQSGTQLSEVVTVGADGVARVLLAEPREYAFPRLSPDGRRLAISVGSSDRRDVWLFDLTSQTMTRLTSDGTSNDRPEWSPDGKRVLYRSDRGAARIAIWWRPADLSGEGSPLVGGPTNRRVRGRDVARHAKRRLSTRHGRGGHLLPRPGRRYNAARRVQHQSTRDDAPSFSRRTVGCLLDGRVRERRGRRAAVPGAGWTRSGVGGWRQ